MLEHPPVEIHATGGASALKRFTLDAWLAADLAADPAAAPRQLAAGEYERRPGAADLDAHVQAFAVPAELRTKPVDRVRLHVLSNHGEEHYTCLYHPRLIGVAAEV